MKNKTFRFFLFFLAGLGLWLGGASVLLAEEFHCEILSLKGSAEATGIDGKTRELKEGDLISKGEIVQASEGGFVDLAFDKEWNNIARVEDGSRLKVTTVYPAELGLEKGGVFAKLKSLPKGSKFEVKTPTAVATVRGTEYRTTFVQGQTEVFNVSPTQVFVYGVRADGSVDREKPVVVEQSKKTQVVKAGAAPVAPQDMSADEQKVTDTVKTEIQTKIQEVTSSGRVANIQSVAELEASTKAQEKKEEAVSTSSSMPQVAPNNTDESRVVDLRRRPFKKVGGAEAETKASK